MSAETDLEPDLAAVPYAPAMLERITTAGPFKADAPIRILDLAAGSGRVSEALLARFPHAQTVLLEPSPALREAAHARLAGRSDRVEIQDLDFARADLPRGFDLIVSLFGFYTLSDIARRAAYRAIYSALLPNGQLTIADFVRSPTPALQTRNVTTWRAEAAAAGIAPEAIAATEERFTAGRGMSLVSELPWLATIGFRDVEIHYKNLGFTVFGGRRPVASEFTITEGGAVDRRRPSS